MKTISDKKYCWFKLVGTREQELQATIDTIERYLDNRSALPWYQFGEKQYLDLLIKRAHNHIVYILKRYDEGEKLS